MRQVRYALILAVGFFLFVSEPQAKEPVFETFQSEHFVIQVQGRDAALVDYALDALESARPRLEKLLGVHYDKPVLVQIYPDRELFQRASGLSDKEIEVSNAIGICRYGKVMLLTPEALAFGYSWLDTVTHEYTHFLINAKTNYRCPLWLHEALAHSFEVLWRSMTTTPMLALDEKLLYNASKSGNFVSFYKMRRGMPTLDTPEEVSLAYAEVKNALEWIIKRWGIDAIPKILTGLGSQTNKDRAFKTAIGLSQKHIERQWRKYVSSLELEDFPGLRVRRLHLKEPGEVIDEISEYVPLDVQDYVRLGDKFRRLDKPGIARMEYKKALEKERYNPVILAKIAKSYAEEGLFKEAKKQYEEIAQVAPNYGRAYPDYGDVLMRLGEYDNAIAQYEHAIQVNPFNPHVHRQLITLYKWKGDEQKIEREQKALSIILGGTK